MKGKTSKVSQVESALDLILKKIQDLESKNIKLEQKLQDHQPSAGRVQGFTNSSPKQVYSSSKGGTSKHKHAGQPHKLLRVEESSYEEFSDPTSPQGCSTQISHFSNTFALQPSLQSLKEDERMQQKVQKRLERQQGQHREPGLQVKPLNLDCIVLGIGVGVNYTNN